MPTESNTGWLVGNRLRSLSLKFSISLCCARPKFWEYNRNQLIASN